MNLENLELLQNILAPNGIDHLRNNIRHRCCTNV